MTTRRSAYRVVEVLCENCGNRFKAYRASAKYCGEACKQQTKRDRSIATAVKEAKELVRAEVQADADRRGSETEVELQEQLRLAELERDIWEKVSMAAIRMLPPGRSSVTR